MRTLKISLLIFILSLTISAQWTPEHWDISFVNPNTGWVVGEYGDVFHTTDGGNSWITQSTGSNDYLLGVFFINESNGWILGDSN